MTDVVQGYHADSPSEKDREIGATSSANDDQGFEYTSWDMLNRSTFDGSGSKVSPNALNEFYFTDVLNRNRASVVVPTNGRPSSTGAARSPWAWPWAYTMLPGSTHQQKAPDQRGQGLSVYSTVAFLK